MRPSRAGALFALAVLLTACSGKQPEHAPPSTATPPLVAPAAAPASASVPVSATARALVAASSAPRRAAAPPKPAPIAPAATASQPSGGPASSAPGARPGPSQSASPAAAGPAILSASALPTVVHEGQTVTWDVHTTTDVVAVDAHVQLASFALRRDRPGHFGLAFQVPSGVPPIFHGTYAVQLTARNSSGASVTRTLELRFE
ncbi:MAG: hypothetical protein ACLPYS_17830 [Vulcanimicrobiaceae bacterium]